MTSESRNVVRPRRPARRAARRSRARRARQVGRAELRVGRRRRARDPSRARVDRRRARRPRPAAGRARSRGRCGPRPRPVALSSSATPWTSLRRLAQRPRVLARGALEQRAVDVEQSSRSGPFSARKSTSGAQPCANAAIRRAVLCDVVELRPSRPASACSAAGSRRRRSGCRRARCGPRPRRCPCERAEAATVNGMPSASAAACSSSKTAAGRASSRASSTGPEPKRWRPSSFSSMPGRVGGERHVDDDRDVRAAARTRSCARRAKVISSCATATRVRRRRARRRPRRRAARPRARRSSRAGCPSSARRRGRWAARPARRRSPRRRRCARSERASSPSFAPMSMCRSCELGRPSCGPRRLQQVDRLLADHAGDDAVARGDLDPLADEDRSGPSRRRR